MPRDKPAFGHPIREIPDDLPNYLPREKSVPSVLQGATIDDYVWLGVDGQLDPDVLVEECLSPSVLLRSVLLAIVKANPSSDGPHEKRVRVAMKALLGKGPRMGRPDASKYDDPLDYMIDSYARGFYGLGPTANSLNALAEQVLQREPEYSAMDDESKASRRRTLRERFEADKDRLLSMKMRGGNSSQRRGEGC